MLRRETKKLSEYFVERSRKTSKNKTFAGRRNVREQTAMAHASPGKLCSHTTSNLLMISWFQYMKIQRKRMPKLRMRLSDAVKECKPSAVANVVKEKRNNPFAKYETCGLVLQTIDNNFLLDTRTRK